MVTPMKPVIFCLEDGMLYRSMLELRLNNLLGDAAEVVYFHSLNKFRAYEKPCDVLISDLHLGDARGEETAAYLLEYCKHTPVIVQSSDPYLPEQLEKRGHGNIVAVEKAGKGDCFEAALTLFLTAKQNQPPLAH
jgi:DNA-binding NtrC family response regulator